MSTKLKRHPNVVLTKDQVETLRGSIVNFTGFQGRLTQVLYDVQQIGEITDETRDQAHGIISQASKALKEHSNLRLDVTRPLDALKKNVTNYEKAEQAPVISAIEEVKTRIQAFDAEKERERQAELARIEAERKAREEAARKERERVDGHKNLIQTLQDQVKMTIENPGSSQNVQMLIETLDEYSSRDWEEFSLDWNEFKALSMADLRRLKGQMEAIESANAEQKAQLEAEAEKKREAMVKQREEEAARAAAERKAQEEADRQAREEAAKAEAKRLRELKAQRAKGLSQGLDTVEIVDIDQIPRKLWGRLLKIDVKRSELLAYLKEEDITEVPGLNITFKSKLLMNG